MKVRRRFRGLGDFPREEISHIDVPLSLINIDRSRVVPRLARIGKAREFSPGVPLRVINEMRDSSLPPSLPPSLSLSLSAFAIKSILWQWF